MINHLTYHAFQTTVFVLLIYFMRAVSLTFTLTIYSIFFLHNYGIAILGGVAMLIFIGAVMFFAYQLARFSNNKEEILNEWS